MRWYLKRFCAVLLVFSVMVTAIPMQSSAWNGEYNEISEGTVALQPPASAIDLNQAYTGEPSELEKIWKEYIDNPYVLGLSDYGAGLGKDSAKAAEVIGESSLKSFIKYFPKAKKLDTWFNFPLLAQKYPNMMKDVIRKYGGKVIKPLAAGLSVILNFKTLAEDTVYLLDPRVKFKGRTTLGKITDGVVVVAEGGLAGYGIAVAVGVVSGPAGWTALGVAGGAIILGVAKEKGWLSSAADWVSDTIGAGVDAVGNGIKAAWDWWNSGSGTDRSASCATGDKQDSRKPNIYIYPETPTEVTVEFEWPVLLESSIPDYTGKWQVTAQEDGTLITSEGERYGYLFYESETPGKYFQMDEGWLIGADTREEQYRAILSEYGFNETETQDFADYWVDKLSENIDYVMYPQMTEMVDEAMPVKITPQPDHVTRIWFVYQPYNGQEFAEAEAEPFTREGYTVVEWGGIVLVN